MDEVGGFPMCGFDSRLFAEYRALVGPTTEAPDAFLWGALAGALSFLIGQQVAFPWGASVQAPTLLIALVGTTGKARKSTSIDDVLQIVVEPLRERSSGTRNEPDPTEIVVGSGSGEGYAAALSDRRYKTEDDEGESVERTMSGRRALYVIHELAALLGKIERGQAGNMMDFLLGCFDARAKWVHRTRNQEDQIVMTGASGIVIAATTETWLVDQLSDVHVMAGFANRFLWLAGDRKCAIPCRPQIPIAEQERFQDLVRESLQALQGAAFQLTDDARELHAAMYRLQFDAQSQDALEDAATARIDIIALRVALVLAAGDGTPLVNEHHVTSGWRVAEYSCRVIANLVQRVRARTLREAEERVLRAAGRVAETKAGPFSKRDVYQRVKGKTGLDAATFNQVWHSLVSVEALEAIDDQGRLYRVAP